MQENNNDTVNQSSECKRRAVIMGASGGIGKAISRELALRNAELTLIGRNQHKLDTFAQELRTCSERSEKRQTENAEMEMGRRQIDGEIDGGQVSVKTIAKELVPDDADLRSFFVQTLDSELRQADMYFHVLGPFLQKPISASTIEDWNEMLFYNLKLPALCAGHAARSMAERWESHQCVKQRQPGVIVLFGGTKTDTVHAYKTNAVYASAKTGLAVFAKSLAREYAGKGVAVIMVCPGIVETEYMTEEKKLAWKKHVPQGMLTQPEQFARAVCDIVLSPSVLLFSGSVITLDEGLLFS